MSFFFLSGSTTAEIYTLSLHDALPIYCACASSLIAQNNSAACAHVASFSPSAASCSEARDRKSTRLNSSHVEISYAVFCLKKKKRNATASTSQRLTWRRDSS